MRMRDLLLISTMFLSLPLSAQMTGDGPSNMMSTEILAPAAGRGPGAEGSQWRTDLWLKSAAGSTVTLEFHPNDSTTDAPAATVSVAMQYPVKRLQDVLKSRFGLDEAVGNIVIRGTKPVSATLRVYTRTDAGSYGSAFMAMPTSLAMSGSGGSMIGNDNYQLYVTGLLPEPSARVNAMVTNAGSEAITGKLDVLDADGQTALGGTASFPFSLHAYSSHQFTNILHGLTSRFGDGGDLLLRLRLADGSTGMVMMLASVIDNETNDTYTVMGNIMSPRP